MGVGLILPLRIIQGLFAAGTLGLSAYVAHWYDADTLTASPSQFNFLIYAAIFSFVSILYLELAPRFAQRATHPYASFAIEVINTLFYFCGFVALAVFLAALLFCRGTVCAAARADVVFASLSFLVWTLSTVVCGKDIFKSGFRATQANHAKARAMSQVV